MSRDDVSKGEQMQKSAAVSFGPSKTSHVLFALKLLGASPLQRYEDVNGDPLYGPCWRHKETWWSVVVLLMSILFSGIFCTHMGMRQFLLFGPEISTNFDWILTEASSAQGNSSDPSGLSSALLTSFRHLVVIITSCITLNHILAWTLHKKLAQFWNNWYRIIGSHFPGSLHGRRLVLPTLDKPIGRMIRLWWTLLLSLPFLAFIYSFTRLMRPHPLFPLEWGLMVLNFLQFFVGGILDEMHQQCMFSSVKNAYAWIREDVVSAASKRGAISVAGLQRWRQIVHDIGLQTRLAGEYLGAGLAIFIIHTVAAGTVSVFVILNGANSSESSEFVKMMSSIVFMSIILRLYVKVSGAVGIRAELQGFRDVIISLDLTCASTTALLQFNGLLESLHGETGEIDIVGAVKLNRRLFLGIFSQIITYLIVVLQFYQVNATHLM